MESRRIQSIGPRGNNQRRRNAFTVTGNDYGHYKSTTQSVFYAHFYDNNGVRRRLSLQTTNLRIARLKYAEIIRRRDRVKNACRTHIKWELFKKKLFAFMSVDKARNTVKERFPINITWQAFKDKLLYHMSVERSRNTVTHTKLAIRYLEEIKKPRYLQDITPELVQKYKEHLLTKEIGKNHINRLVQCIKTAMHRGEKWGLVGKQDWMVVKKIKAPRGSD